MGLEQYTVRIEKVPFPTASSEAINSWKRLSTILGISKNYIEVIS